MDNMTSSPSVSRADGCLLAGWQVYDKVFVIFNQVSSFTPISGPAQDRGRTERSRNKNKAPRKEQVFDKSLAEIVLFDNNNMRTVCPPSACLLISRARPDLRIQSHYCKSVDNTIVPCSTTNNIPSPSLTVLLFDRLLQGFQNCQVQSAMSYL